MPKDVFDNKLIELTNKKEMITYEISYEKFIEYIPVFEKYYGLEGLVQTSFQVAALCFYKFENIRFIITHSRNYKTSDFQLSSLKLDIVCSKPRAYQSMRERILDDIKNNWKVLFLIFIIFLAVFCPYYNNDLENIKGLNSVLIDISSILMGAVLVFIGFFNGDRERTIMIFKKGLFDKEISTDMYVIKIIIGAIIFSTIANSVAGFNCSSKTISDIVQKYISYQLYVNIKYIIVCILVFAAVTCLTICFDSILNYYLKKVRNYYFMESFEELLKEKSEKKKS